MTSKRIKVYDLPETATEDELGEFLSPVGAVRSIEKITPPEQPPVFVVEMDSEEAARRAELLDGHGISVKRVAD